MMQQFNKKIMITSMTLAFVLTLSACGKKGPLVQPTASDWQNSAVAALVVRSPA